jgi:transcriptional antiterminator
MAATRNLGGQILELRKTMSYRKIQEALKCSKRTINYHCKKNGVQDTGNKRFPITVEQQNDIYEFCKTNTPKQAIEHFKFSKSTIEKYRKGGVVVP